MSGFRSISSIFDDTIFNLFGFPFEEIFTIPSAENYTYQKKTISNNDDTYTVIKKGDKTNLYHNGKQVKESDVPAKVMSQLRNAPTLNVRPNVYLPEGCNNKLPAELVSGTEFPWMNMMGGEDGSLLLKFGLTDVDEDRVSIDFDDDYLFVHIDPKEDSEEEFKQAVFVKEQTNKFIDGKKLDKAIDFLENINYLLTIDESEATKLVKKYAKDEKKFPLIKA